MHLDFHSKPTQQQDNMMNKRMNSDGGLIHPTKNERNKKDKDEDLLLFRELHRRANISLLQPVSDEFEPNGGVGNHSIYKYGSTKKAAGLDLFVESEKNDYDWLKTPPATPLFPSLEMEANAKDLVKQREIPILQTLSRFAGKGSEPEPTIGSIKPNKTRVKPAPRSVAPSHRPSTIQQVGTRIHEGTSTNPNQKITSRGRDAVVSSRASHVEDKKQVTKPGPEVKPTRNRGSVSPLVRSTLPGMQFPGLINQETPANLRKDRPMSATRGRPISSVKSGSTNQQVKENVKSRRQSCSPSVTRGRKLDENQSIGDNFNNNVKGMRGQVAHGNGNQFLGSKMVEKVMNARKSGIQGRDQLKHGGQIPSMFAPLDKAVTRSYGH